MKPIKTALLALFAVVGACTTVNVEPSPSAQPFTDGPPNAEDSDGAGSGSADVPEEKPKDDSSIPGSDDGGVEAGDDSGSSDPGPSGADSGGGGGPGGADSGGPGGPGPGDPGPGGPGTPEPIVSNFHNWPPTWPADSDQCPEWEPAPADWREPRTDWVGAQACDFGVAMALYEAYFGPNASPAAQAAWDAANPTCKMCAFSNWSELGRGPVVRTPGGHYFLNNAACFALKDPSRKSCAMSWWQRDQCAREACDHVVTQAAYDQCVSASTHMLDGSCNQASLGGGKAFEVLWSSDSPAWNPDAEDLFEQGCWSTAPTDHERMKKIVTQVVTAQCW